MPAGARGGGQRLVDRRPEQALLLRAARSRRTAARSPRPRGGAGCRGAAMHLVDEPQQRAAEVLGRAAVARAASCAARMRSCRPVSLTTRPSARRRQPGRSSSYSTPAPSIVAGTAVAPAPAPASACRTPRPAARRTPRARSRRGRRRRRRSTPPAPRSTRGRVKCTSGTPSRATSWCSIARYRSKPPYEPTISRRDRGL